MPSSRTATAIRIAVESAIIAIAAGTTVTHPDGHAFPVVLRTLRDQNSLDRSDVVDDLVAEAHRRFVASRGPSREPKGFSVSLACR